MRCPPIASSKGCTRSLAAFGPATQTMSCRATAVAGMPKIGAST
jgi:hypothetical protein